jgi:hypothetical protein
MTRSFADILRLLKPDASLFRRPAEARPEGEPKPEAAARSILARLQGALPARQCVTGDGAAEDVATRRLAAMARAERARADRARAGHAVMRATSARMA